MKTQRNRNLRYGIVLHGSMFRNRLQPAVRRKRRVLWSSGLCLQRDMDGRLTARRAAKQILDLKLPPHSPDLAPSNFHPFGTLRNLFVDVTSDRMRR